jgi:thiosulfate dehydrogenase
MIERKRLSDRMAAAVERNRFPLLQLGSAAALVLVGAAVAAIALLSLLPVRQTDAGAAATTAAFSPPPLSDIPAGPEGEAIKRGMAIFDDPRTHAAAFVGNAMACKNCHLDSGRRADSSPMWAAWVSYPQFRKKTGTINTMEDRIRGCFLYSMNAPNSPSGAPPPEGSDVYRDLQAYFHWLATGVPTAERVKGAGYPTPPLSQSGFDPARGARVFEAKCTGCHGADGQGATQPDGKVVYPPLWGPRSFNWGAGMARVDLAAGFIRANMPFDKPGSLTDQEAWDVAAFVDSHERPKDPRQTGSVAENAKANFSGQKSYYGRVVDGKLLGAGAGAAR